MNSTPSPPDADEMSEAVLLPVNGDTASAPELHAKLVALLDREGPMHIDAGAVDHVGQAVLQLLLATCREATAAGRPIAFVNPSPAFCDRVERCRLTNIIEFEPSGADA